MIFSKHAQIILERSTIGRKCRISDGALVLGNRSCYNKTCVIFVMMKGTVITNDIISEELSLNQTHVNVHSNFHLLGSYHMLTALLTCVI